MSSDPERGPEALKRLDRDLAAFEAGRSKPVGGGMGGAADGYRLLGQLLGGVLGGIGFGWLVDHFVHTSPWGLVAGLVIGSGLSIYATVRTASQIGARAEKNLGPAASAPRNEDEDD